MHVTSYARGNVKVLVIPSNVTFANVTYLNIALGEHSQDDSFRHAVIDMREVHMLCSAGVGALVQFLRAMQAREGRLALAQITPEVWEVLSTMHLIGQFVVADSVPEALTKLAALDPQTETDTPER